MAMEPISVEKAMEIAKKKGIKPGRVKGTNGVQFTKGRNSRLEIIDWVEFQSTLSKKAINYVWASNTKKNYVWPNAFAGDHAMMLALRGPEAPLNTWQTEKRNVRADFKQLFGEEISSIDAVAIMTDTDNSNGQVSAVYGDIWFSKD